MTLRDGLIGAAAFAFVFTTAAGFFVVGYKHRNFVSIHIPQYYQAALMSSPRCRVSAADSDGLDRIVFQQKSLHISGNVDSNALVLTLSNSNLSISVSSGGAQRDNIDIPCPSAPGSYSLTAMAVDVYGGKRIDYMDFDIVDPWHRF